MWATADESREDIVGLYRRVWANSDGTIEALELDTVGRVPWWPEDRNEVTLHRLLLHMIAETHRHAGHADIVRETIDGAAGLRADNDNLAEGDARWAEYRIVWSQRRSLAIRSEPLPLCTTVVPSGNTSGSPATLSSSSRCTPTPAVCPHADAQRRVARATGLTQHDQADRAADKPSRCSDGACRLKTRPTARLFRPGPLPGR